MKAVIETVLKHVGPGKVKLDDFVDRLCSRYTPMLLGLFMFVTGTVDNFGKPINCMIPQEYSSTWTNYVLQYCYVTGTYLKPDGGLPFLENDNRIYVHYYQWVPYVLIIQALALRLPLCVWRLGQRMSDIEFGYVNELCVSARASSGEKREKHLQEATDYINQAVRSRKSRNGLGSLASYVYVLYKLLNIIVVFAQIYLLNVFVGYHSWDWGFTLFGNTWNWNEHKKLDAFKYFPRVAYCQFSRQFLGNEVEEEVQCTLGINMLNEKVFLCLYFWYYSLVALTVFNAIFHAHHLLSPFRVSEVRSLLNYGMVFNVIKQRKMVGNSAILDPGEGAELDVEGQGKRVGASRIGFVASSANRGTWSSGDSRQSSRHSTEAASKPSAQDVARFVDECLGQDGLLLLRWVHQNAGGLVAAELTVRFYHINVIGGN